MHGLQTEDIEEGHQVLHAPGLAEGLAPVRPFARTEVAQRQSDDAALLDNVRPDRLPGAGVAQGAMDEDDGGAGSVLDVGHDEPVDLDLPGDGLGRTSGTQPRDKDGEPRQMMMRHRQGLPRPRVAVRSAGAILGLGGVHHPIELPFGEHRDDAPERPFVQAARRRPRKAGLRTGSPAGDRDRDGRWPVHAASERQNGCALSRRPA